MGSWRDLIKLQKEGTMYIYNMLTWYQCSRSHYIQELCRNAHQPCTVKQCGLFTYKNSNSRSACALNVLNCPRSNSGCMLRESLLQSSKVTTPVVNYLKYFMVVTTASCFNFTILKFNEMNIYMNVCYKVKLVMVFNLML